MDPSYVTQSNIPAITIAVLGDSPELARLASGLVMAHVIAPVLSGSTISHRNGPGSFQGNRVTYTAAMSACEKNGRCTGDARYGTDIFFRISGMLTFRTTERAWDLLVFD